MNKLTSHLGQDYARAAAVALAKSMDEALVARPPKVKKLTRWQRFYRFMTRRRSLGRWITYKLMSHYDIYEGDW